jgi:hypothetical protein
MLPTEITQGPHGFTGKFSQNLRIKSPQFRTISSGDTKAGILPRP